MKRAVLLPGQGVANFKFLGEIVAKNPALRKHFNTAQEALGSEFVEQLSCDSRYFHSTSKAQPAILLSSYLIAKNRELKLRPGDVVAGHSLGEFSALVLAGGLSLAQALRLVQKRGELMENCVGGTPYEMHAILLHPSKFDEVLAFLGTRGNVGESVYVSNINSQKQIVFVGSPRDSAGVFASLRSRKTRFKTVQLPVTIPFHSPYLQEAQDALREFVATLEFNPVLSNPIVTNYKFQSVTDTKEAVGLIVENTTRVVDYLGLVRSLHGAGVGTVTCIGPGTLHKHVETISKCDGWSASVDQVV